MRDTYSPNLHSVECPHCGEENNLADLYSDLNGPESATATCRDCENEFRASFHVSISVTCAALEKGGVK